uniref:Uncharacterized protein At4g37920, chloroplastic-like n=1 Tax=Nicotiana tabacum TaxID=4097 RepID=A0A1S4CKX3_TOBAC
VAKLGNTCLAAVQAYDKATESIETLNAAELKFQDIINSPSVDAACKKIDDLAQKNQLDSALVLMITKAWSAAKESDMTKDEVKDVLYHLYTTARGNLQRLMPKEIRILKYLLTIEDPEERLCTLKDAFTPGEELEGKDVNCLYTISRSICDVSLTRCLDVEALLSDEGAGDHFLLFFSSTKTITLNFTHLAVLCCLLGVGETFCVADDSLSLASMPGDGGRAPPGSTDEPLFPQDFPWENDKLQQTWSPCFAHQHG